MWFIGCIGMLIGVFLVVLGFSMAVEAGAEAMARRLQ